jgi:O-antigen/teichoic acid export membrane protein
MWVGIEKVLSRGLRIASYAVMARVLGNDLIGLFGLAVITLTLSNRFSELGIDTALVARDGDIEDILPTAFSLQLARGVVLAVVLYAVAPLVAIFFSDPRATGLVRAIAIVPILDALHNPGLVTLDRELDFRRLAGLNVAEEVTYAAVGVGVVLATGSVLAPVAGIVAKSVVRATGSFLIVSVRAVPAFDYVEARRLISYGKWLTGTSILGWLTREGDDALVGAVLGTGALGFYRTAYQFGRAPQTEITGVINRVAFPSYANVQTDAHALRVGYRRTLQLTGALAFPAAVGAAIVAPVFVPVVLGDGWTEAVPVMQVLALTTVFHTVGASAAPLFQALDRPDLHTKIQFGVLVVLGVTIIPLIQAYGIVGAGLSVVLSVALTAPVRAYFAARLLEARLIEQVAPLAPPAAATAAMAAVVVPLSGMVPVSVVGLVGLIASGVVVYAAATLALHAAGVGVLGLAQELLGAARG